MIHRSQGIGEIFEAARLAVFKSCGPAFNEQSLALGNHCFDIHNTLIIYFNFLFNSRKLLLLIQLQLIRGTIRSEIDKQFISRQGEYDKYILIFKNG